MLGIFLPIFLPINKALTRSAALWSKKRGNKLIFKRVARARLGALVTRILITRALIT
jgi:hypothetical protein